MDNVTHSLVGFAMAEACVQWRLRRRKPTPLLQRRAFWGVALIGANLPDIDGISSLAGGRLGYLLHHRGVTHTLVGMVVLGILLGWASLRWAGRRNLDTKDHRRWILGLLSASLLSHVLLDCLNLYGTHVFWPFRNVWDYGDSLFILEPWLWVSLLPALRFATEKKSLRLWLGVLYGIAVGMVVALGYVPWTVAFAVVVWGTGLWWICRKADAFTRIVVAWVAFTIPLTGFIASSYVIKGRLTERLGKSATSRVWDIALSPAPADPLCWFVFTAETQGATYRSRAGIYAPIPGWISAAKCPKLGVGQGTMPLEPVEEPSDESLLWVGQFRYAAKDLRELSEKNCVFAAFLRFSRMPFVQVGEKDILMGDLRFDRARGMEFSEIQTPREPFRCPERVPPWEPPLEFLLKR